MTLILLKTVSGYTPLPVDISQNALCQREPSIHPEVALWSRHQRVAHPVEEPVGLVLWSNSAHECVLV